MDGQSSPPPPNQPPPYRPPRSSGVSPVVWILGGSCGLALLGVAAAIGIGVLVGRGGFAAPFGGPTGGRGGGASPGVLTGSANWRTLRSGRSAGGGYAAHEYQGVIAGDVDGDGDDELLALDMLGTPELMEIDGTGITTLSPTPGGPLALWDANGNGTAEIIISDMTTQQIKAMDGKGNVISTLPFTPVMQANMNPMGGAYQLIGDADGDGKDELWLTPKGSHSDLSAVSSKGKVLVTWSGSMMGERYLVCDYDGNGEHGCAMVDYSDNLTLVTVKGTRQLGKLRGHAISGCMDVNGDKQPDLLCGEDGYFDHASARYVAFPQRGGFAPPYDFAGTYVQFDFDGDGQPEQVYAGPDAHGKRGGGMFGGGSGMHGRIRVFDPRTQTVLYDEVVDQGYMQSIGVAHAGGKAYLVVPRRDELLIYP